MNNKFKNFKLAFVDNTTFDGIDAQGFYAAALLEGKSLNSFKLVPNVKSKIKLAQLNLGEILQDADCTFTSGGTGELDQKSFETNAIKVNLEYCQRTFEQNYLSELLRAGSNSDASIVPETVESFLLGQVAKQIAADLEKVTWQGGATGGAYPLTVADGLEKKMIADATIVDVAIVAVTAANAIAEMTKVFNAIPDTILHKEDLSIFVSSNVYRAYKQALASASAETNFMQSYNNLVFLGVPVIEAPGMSANKMVAGQTSNFLFLTDLVSDMEDVLVLPQKSVTGQPVVRMVAEFKFGADYLYGSEIVFGAV